VSHYQGIIQEHECKEGHFYLDDKEVLSVYTYVHTYLTYICTYIHNIHMYIHIHSLEQNLARMMTGAQ